MESAWEQLRTELLGRAGELTYRSWLEPLELAAWTESALFLRAPAHLRSWVEESYLGTIADAASAIRGHPQSVELVGDDWRGENADEPGARVAGGPADSTSSELLNPRYTFDQFVIGEGNHLAHAAALAVAEQPGQTYNPFFLYGPPGLGKTHLLHAIGNYVQVYGGGLSVRYATIEAFTNEFVRALKEGGTENFKRRFREADVVLIDDIQFLADKTRTKEEFFHCFNALYESGRQLVITSDQPPNDLESFESRLRERFGCGLVAELAAPGYEMRVAILRKRARLDALRGVNDETLLEIAGLVTNSVRVLEGALVRVVAYASLSGEPATPELARRVLERLQPRQPEIGRTPARIRTVTAETFGVDPGALLAQDRRPRVALARQVAMYLTRELTDASLPEIGAGFGGRRHSTVLHAHRQVADRMRVDSNVRATVEQLRRRFGSEDDRS